MHKICPFWASTTTMFVFEGYLSKRKWGDEAIALFSSPYVHTTPGSMQLKNDAKLLHLYYRPELSI